MSKDKWEDERFSGKCRTCGQRFLSDLEGRFCLVYQFGHGDVWCNGFKHIKIGGGRFGSAPTNSKEKVAEIEIVECGCKWIKPEGFIVVMPDHPRW